MASICSFNEGARSLIRCKVNHQHWKSKGKFSGDSVKIGRDELYSPERLIADSGCHLFHYNEYKRVLIV